MDPKHVFDEPSDVETTWLPEDAQMRLACESHSSHDSQIRKVMAARFLHFGTYTRSYSDHPSTLHFNFWLQIAKWPTAEVWLVELLHHQSMYLANTQSMQRKMSGNDLPNAL